MLNGVDEYREMMKVYCIIPVYNVEKYLPKCIKSVLKQSYSNIEIILVNDASTDNSALICKQFQSNFPDKIHIIDKPNNEGVDKARFLGLDYIFSQPPSNGGVMFIDSDDYLEKDAVIHLVESMTRENSDVIQMKANRVLGFIKRPYFSPLPAQTIKSLSHKKC